MANPTTEQIRKAHDAMAKSGVPLTWIGALNAISEALADEAEAMQAGFKGGWAAAHIDIATGAEKNGDNEFSVWCRARADHPPAIEVVNVDDDASAETWTCPDCKGEHHVKWGGIRIGHPCPRTAPPDSGISNG